MQDPIPLSCSDPVSGKRQVQEPSGLRALMEYRHIDISRLHSHSHNAPPNDSVSQEHDDLEEQIDDSCLFEVLEKQEESSGGGGIVWVFCKNNARGDAIQNVDGVRAGKEEIVSNLFKV